MYSKFDLSISDYYYNSELNQYIELGEKIYNEHAKIARSELNQFIYANGHIDGTALKDNWFEMEDVDIFISHSHKDISKVKALAGWLYDKFELKVFIDSCVWGYCDELLREIDNKYCYNKDKKIYNYNLRNYTTSHVHMMLSTALSEMIDRTECIIFYNTPESIYMADDIGKIKKGKNNKKVTLSPWIYHELAMTSMIKRTEPKREVCILEKSLRYDSEKNTINIEHDVDKYLKNMISIAEEDLSNWWREYDNLKYQIHGNSSPIIKEKNIHPLDLLYRLQVL